MPQENTKKNDLIKMITILVAGLGYIVDIYDLLLFGVLRVPSLTAIGVPADQLLSVGSNLLNTQLIGLILGSFFWGILADKIGRTRGMFGSIALYSIATLANAYVTSAEQYTLCRFFAGIGMAGEFGIAVTLAAEMLSQKYRGYAVMFVVTLGSFGFMTAAMLANSVTWQTAYQIGGIAGFVILILRAAVLESPLFKAALKDCTVQSRGSLRVLWGSRERIIRYFACIGLGITLPFSTMILSVFAPEIATALSIPEKITAAQASIYFGSGIIAGDLFWAMLSQLLKSRRRALMICLMCYASCFAALAIYPAPSKELFLWIYFFIGLTAVSPALHMVTISEQFGTNIRATATTTVAGIMRGTTIVMVMVMSSLSAGFGILNAITAIGVTAIVLGFISLSTIKETFSADLHYLEK